MIFEQLSCNYQEPSILYNSVNLADQNIKIFFWKKNLWKKIDSLSMMHDSWVSMDEVMIGRENIQEILIMMEQVHDPRNATSSIGVRRSSAEGKKVANTVFAFGRFYNY